ncbi:MAG: prolyl oligopeptidase family serine peptidase [Clostridia bacterium]|nr:prolyl oligopeptidase family serine peptidase [Clostridia bacterium]
MDTEMQEIEITSTIDGSKEPSLFYKASGTEKRPLLVGLHTWSCDRFNQIANMLPYAKKHNFHLLLPEFRGPNLASNPRAMQACGSPLVRQDIKDAIDYIVQSGCVDEENIFLLGLSGGGYTSLLMSAFYPKLFKAVGAFAPISDLKRWTEENKNYAPHVFVCCNHDEAQIEARSPINYLDGLAASNLKIFHGKNDKVVSVEQSVDLYYTLRNKYPQNRVFLDIFDGGHVIDMEVAFHWILSQYGAKKAVEITG